MSQFPGGQVAITKQLVCLANSRKHGGRCIAGIDIKSNTWIRPISSRSGHEVSESERKYRNGAEPSALDVISMQLVRHRQHGFQSENWILDSSVRWEKLGRIRWDDLRRLEQRPTRLWINSGDSTARGLNDRVPVARQGEIADSLKLIRVNSATILVDRPYDANRELDVRAEFHHAGSTYTLKVTDSTYEEKFRKRGIGTYRLAESFLTVSLGEEFRGYLYKMVAAIIECHQTNR
ncbi:dual OB domain-containing protein [Streptomyces decoyicus]|uniref:dual OB domain-containing protein n=1 Tax=Streptomyces decoyicus TaxID=249567 RepID=UPI003F4D28E9